MEKTSTSLVEDFQRYFNLELASEPAKLAQVFRIRYRVYCEEFGYEDAKRFPDGLESDEFDSISRHTLVSHTATGMAAGCARLVLADEDTLMPMEQHCGAAIDREILRGYDGRRDTVCEFSRLGVDGAFRRRMGEKASRFGEIDAIDCSHREQRTFSLIAVATILSGLALSEILERPHCFAMMEPFLPRLLRRSGLIVHLAGDEVDYHGLRSPYYWETREMVAGMVDELHEFYNHIRDSFARGEPVAAALNEGSNGQPDVRIAPDSIP
ncbi:MAG: PEP-CTERM/exosortase system-associated acyltransferase [Halioglobus sp.]|nr:PEP-CTERM/exosortase system-associated acyltransferase [Halioglobus sp.]